MTDNKTHAFTLTDRKNMTLSGVLEVLSFSDALVELKTSMGALNIKGSGLTIDKLNKETGELAVNGEVDSLQYAKIKNKDSFMRLFK